MVSANEKTYGSQYRTVVKSGNIKIVEAREGSEESLLETMTRGRVYGLVNSKGNLGSIVYFGNDGRRVKRIDLDHSHRKMKPHTQHGYLNEGYDGRKGASKVTSEEKRMVERVKKLWETRDGKN